MRLQGKTSIVTGAGGGIGFAIAEKFAREGATVVIAEMDADKGRQAAEKLDAAGFKAETVTMDVSRAPDWTRVISHIVDRYGRIDILVNNAAVALVGQDRTPVDTVEMAWDTTLNVNLKGVYLGCGAVIPAMLEQGGGSIVNIASLVAHMGSNPPQIAYTASKGGVISMTRDIAVTYARQNIRVNCVSPGGVATEMLMALSSDPEKERKRNVHIPMNRLGKPEEIANAVAFLASDEASYITGQYLCVDGGANGALITEP